MKEFLFTYWREILYVICALITIVFFFIRKKPVQVLDTFKELILRLLPYCINEAEKAPKGEKLSASLRFLKSVLADMGYELNADYEKFALEQVEIILSTPQKKGIKK